MDSYTFTGRQKKPLGKKLNPVWWWMNDDEQTVDQADWYHPEWPRWRRVLYWNAFRNPLQNFRCYVIGVQDRNYTVYGRRPVLTVQRNDLQPPETGWQWCVILLSGWFPLLFLSYSGSRLVAYLGWQPTGFFGAKLNL